MKGVPLKVVATLMGHSTTAVTERYAHLSPHVEREAVDVLVTGSSGSLWGPAAREPAAQAASSRTTDGP